MNELKNCDSCLWSKFCCVDDSYKCGCEFSKHYGAKVWVDNCEYWKSEREYVDSFSCGDFDDSW